jgi:hypothetical protein
VTPVLLRCTRGLLKLIGGRVETLVEAEPGIDGWYANAFSIERRKCLLLVHADTPFSVLDTNVRVAQLDDLGPYVATLILGALASEGLARTTLGPTDPSGVRVAKTSSRSVLGHMTEIKFEAQHLIAQDGGLRHTDLDRVNQRLRRGLHRRGSGYVLPLELAFNAQPDTRDPRERKQAHLPHQEGLGAILWRSARRKRCLVSGPGCGRRC